jgi:hypothetical protein
MNPNVRLVQIIFDSHNMIQYIYLRVIASRPYDRGVSKMRSFLRRVLVVSMLTAGVLGWAATQSVVYASGWVKIINKSDRNMEHLYISFSRDTNWEQDVLGDGVLLSGYNQTFDIRKGGCYVDLRAVMEDGTPAERRNVNVCSGYEWTLDDEE